MRAAAGPQSQPRPLPPARPPAKVTAPPRRPRAAEASFPPETLYLNPPRRGRHSTWAAPPVGGLGPAAPTSETRTATTPSWNYTSAPEAEVGKGQRGWDRVSKRSLHWATPSRRRPGTAVPAHICHPAHYGFLIQSLPAAGVGRRMRAAPAPRLPPSCSRLDVFSELSSCGIRAALYIYNIIYIYTYMYIIYNM